MKSAVDIKFKIATTLLNIQVGGYEEGSQLDGARYAFEQLLHWIDEDA